MRKSDDEPDANMAEELIDAGVELQENASAARTSQRNIHQHGMPTSQSYWVASGIFLCCLECLLVPESDTGVSCS